MPTDEPEQVALAGVLSRPGREAVTELSAADAIPMLLATAMGAAADGMLITDHTGRILWINEAFTAITGFPAAEAIGKTPRILKSGEHDAEFYRGFWRTISSGKPWRGEFTNRRKDGTLCHDEHTVTPVRDSSGKITHYVGILHEVTARKRAEEALRESEERLRFFVEHSPAAVAMLDRDMRYLVVSRRWLKDYRLPEVNLIGRTHYEVFPEIPERWKEIHRRCLEGAVERCEADPFPRADGTLDWVRWEVRPWRKAQGEPAGLIIFSEVITQRVQAEEALRWKTAFLEAQVDSSFDGLLVVDDRNRKILQNERFNQLWKIPRRIIEDQDDAEQLRFAASQTRNPIEFAERAAYLYGHPKETGLDEIELLDGTVMERYSAPVLGKDGTCFGRIWSFRDVTERKRAEERIADALTFNRTMLAASPLGILAYAADGRCVTANAAAARMVGATVDQLLVQNFRELESWKRAGWVAAAERAIESGTEQELEARFTTTFGKEVWLWVRCAGFRYGGEPHLLVVFADIAERKQLEARLLRSQRMEAIGSLAGGIAHDLNNVLAPILLATELLNLNIEDPESARVLETIADCAKRGGGMVKQILAFARGSEGERGLVQPIRLVTEVLGIAQHTFPTTIQIRADIAPDARELLGNPTQLHQVLLNLCINARDAMPEGGTLTLGAASVRLDTTAAVSVSPEAKPGHYTVLTVIDTGTGMTPEVRARMFEAFFSTKPAGQGTGLGLSTVQTIVKEHGGFVSVETEVGRGTTFAVYLPAVEPAAEWPVAAVVPVLPVGKGQLVLVVDDEATIRSGCSQALETFGYRVLTAGDGVQATMMCSPGSPQPDLLLTDVGMPLMDGQATIGAIRRLKPGLPVIVMSGTDSPYGQEFQQKFGVQGFLQKPFSTQALVCIVHDVLDAAREK